jgi:hypothetical protein|tara:strand:+ start:657 stop:821 length:165 start_codon:yes stop_codon:yes gene_type:complete
MIGIVRKEQIKHERIIRKLWFKMNDVYDPRDRKKLAYAIEYHVQLLGLIEKEGS